MSDTQTLKTLQLFYAGALVDAVRQYAQQGVLESVTENKRKEQELSARAQIERLGIRDPEEIFTTFTRIFGCADWKVEVSPEVRAETKTCLACALAKKLGAPSPCDISCINPLRAQAGALQPAHRLVVDQTLWNAPSCVFRMEKGN